MALRISVSPVFLAVCFLSSGMAVSRPGASITPQRGAIKAIWHEDLRSAVGSVPLGIIFGEESVSRLPYVTLRFVNNDTVVATFVIREGAGTPALSHRDMSNAALPLRLRGIFLTTSNGKVKDVTDWPTQSRYSGIVAAYDGKFIVQAGDLLTLYTSDLRAQKTLRLPPLRDDEYKDWKPYTAPTGRRILFLQNTTDANCWIWVNAETLKVERSWEEPQTGWVAITDNRIAMIKCTWGYKCKRAVIIKELEGEWTAVAPSGEDDSGLQFANDKMLFISGAHARLVGTSGDEIFEVTDPKTERVPNAVAAASASRIVFPGFRGEGGSALLRY